MRTKGALHGYLSRLSSTLRQQDKITARIPSITIPDHTVHHRHHKVQNPSRPNDLRARTIILPFLHSTLMKDSPDSPSPEPLLNFAKWDTLVAATHLTI